MQAFTLHFSFYGYYMKTTVEADSLEQARDMVRTRVEFIENVPPTPPRQPSSDPTVNHLKDIFGMFN